MNSDRMYMEHIRDAIEKILRFSSEGQEAFYQDDRTQDAIIRNFEIIGEAVKQLSDDVRQAYPDIPWRRVAGFRDVLIHDYMGVKLDLVWVVIIKELPALHAAVKAYLALCR
ncbi:MAG: DUF86 domain-containing protein [Phycisphaerae bacterium]|nr:DUF86 domain-containing protein [Phycisphaerae bacterium]